MVGEERRGEGRRGGGGMGRGRRREEVRGGRREEGGKERGKAKGKEEGGLGKKSKFGVKVGGECENAKRKENAKASEMVEYGEGENGVNKREIGKKCKSRLEEHY